MVTLLRENTEKRRQFIVTRMLGNVKVLQDFWMVTLLNADRGKTLNFFRNVANADRCRKCWRILERLSGSRGAVKLATQKWEANSKKGAVKRERSMREARGGGKNPLSKFGKQLQGGYWCLFFEWPIYLKYRNGICAGEIPSQAVAGVTCDGVPELGERFVLSDQSWERDLSRVFWVPKKGYLWYGYPCRSGEHIPKIRENRGRVRAVTL